MEKTSFMSCELNSEYKVKIIDLIETYRSRPGSRNILLMSSWCKLAEKEDCYLGAKTVNLDQNSKQAANVESWPRLNPATAYEANWVAGVVALGFGSGVKVGPTFA